MFDPWVRKIPWRNKWQPTPVLLSGKFHGLRSLVGYSPWGRKELDMTEGSLSGLGYRAIHAETKKLEKPKKQASPKIGAPKPRDSSSILPNGAQLSKVCESGKEEGGVRMRGPHPSAAGSSPGVIPLV